MTDLSDKAIEAARVASITSKDGSTWIGDSLWMPQLEAAYPIIRADVIAEIVDAMRKQASTRLPEDRVPIKMTADFIEREFGSRDEF